MKETAKSHITFVVVAGIVRPAMNFLMRKQWIGLEKLPDGGFIAAPNHCTEIDPLVVGHMLYNQQRMPHFLAKAGLFKVPVLGFVLRATKQIPVERSSAGANRSLQIAKEVVNGGGAIIIYPEGTLTRDPELWPMKGHTGAARMALESGIPVVPMAHWGAHEVLPRYAKRFHVFPRKTSRLVVGDPVDLSAFAGRPLDKATLSEATHVIMDAITELLATLRGGQPPLVRWDPSVHNQSTHGRIIDQGGTTGGSALSKKDTGDSKE
ncbi:MULTISPECIES: lysophospholipid acyltransferase family protein [unclassified Arthrobacter]|uniref:lysophospholipid acyltransferase family protein n=1 Tax=unclassified Arthrobacter TaxID=235627 RepID=UPI002E085595|nr:MULTISPECIES: lysophospholipid acyltransferase family protein [unclassified Arthrobacter]MEC5193338.1 1-acyl-sn-glycerol-3-phosphate acyltransferase [Arthrobacter sp. MP_M4]MEC5204804.1 1-acyl-sn-glycerol-3-phosphate acyltransferase [Arthrobacter sp. MP_M7]